MTVDPDQLAVRRAARRVGVQLAIAISVLVVIVLAATLLFVISHLEPDERFNFSPHASTVDVNGIELLGGGLLIGLAAIALIVAVSRFATQRAVEPLAEALRIQRSFVADASHELRTPIAVLNTRLQLLERRLADEDENRELVTALRRDTTALTAVVNDLLDAAGGQDDAIQEPSAADEVVTATVESMQLLAAARQVQLSIDRLDPVHCAMPPTPLRRCLTALIDNAIKHAPTGSVVAIRLLRDSQHAEFSVRDSGRGIQGIDPERVFDRFSRGSAEGARDGLGIGLALVKDTVLRHGGSIRVVNRSHGAEFVVRIPRERARDDD